MNGIAIIDLPVFLWRLSLRELFWALSLLNENTDGTAPFLNHLFVVLSLKSEVKKCSKQTFVFEVI